MYGAEHVAHSPAPGLFRHAAHREQEWERGYHSGGSGLILELVCGRDPGDPGSFNVIDLSQVRNQPVYSSEVFVRKLPL